MSNNITTGRIISLRAGTYTVLTEKETLQCRARGRFRKDGTTPLVGDMAAVEELGGGEGYIKELLPRKNALRRPALANLDQLFLVCSMAQPAVNPRILDYLIASAELCDIAPVIVFTKCDLCTEQDVKELLDIYRAFPCFAISMTEDAEDISDELGGIKALMEGKLSAFCGNTGVGKSTLLNRLDPLLELPTGEISMKLGRGRHTTRHAELFPVAGGWVADTPGFSALEPAEQEGLTKETLALCYREFAPYEGQCRFQDCAHVKDKGCRVLEAVAAGEIPKSRWESYAALYEELKQKNAWEQ